MRTFVQKKVDLFVKIYLKRSGTAFNPVMDRRLMNIHESLLLVGAGGISLEDVLKMADWTGPSSFLRFYYRPSFTDDFAREVLQ